MRGCALRSAKAAAPSAPGSSPKSSNNPRHQITPAPPGPDRPAAGAVAGCVEECSSTGRAPVSKTGGWGFEPLHSCHALAGLRRDGTLDGNGQDQRRRIRPAGSPGGVARHLADPQGNHGHDGDGVPDGVHRRGLLLRHRPDPVLRGPAPVRPRAIGGRAMASRWYVIHVYSGFEKRVAQAIREQAEQKGLSDRFEQILVPTEEVVEVKRGARVSSERKFFPGYVLIKMDLDDETWHLVKNTAKVTGFLGGRGRPSPISEGEAARIMRQVQEGIERPKPSITYEVGEQVRVCDGPFTSFNGIVEEVDEEKSRIKVAVSIFGRATPVELEYAQVEKV